MNSRANENSTPRHHNQVLQSRKLDLNKLLREHFAKEIVSNTFKSN